MNYSLIVEGMLLGLILAITPGPVFFTIIQTGITRGFWPGFKIAIGVLLSDITLILISFWGISQIVYLLEQKEIVGLIGGIILIIFGTVSYIRKPSSFRPRHPKLQYQGPGTLEFVFKGFFLNLTNPTLIFFWLSAMTWVSSQADKASLPNAVLAFFTGTVTIILLTDLLKSYIGVKIKDYLNIRVQLWINRFVGLFLVGSGAFLIVSIFYRTIVK